MTEPIFTLFHNKSGTSAPLRITACKKYISIQLFTNLVSTAQNDALLYLNNEHDISAPCTTYCSSPTSATTVASGFPTVERVIFTLPSRHNGHVNLASPTLALALKRAQTCFRLPRKNKRESNQRMGGTRQR